MGGKRRQGNSDSAGNTNYHLDRPPLAGNIHAKKRRSRDERAARHHDSAFLNTPPSPETKRVGFPLKGKPTNQTNQCVKQKKGPIRRTEKNSNQHTFLFIGLCMQQASEARAEQKPLVMGQGSLFKFYAAQLIKPHLQDWGVCGQKN